jgi:hypothetical protein
MFFQTFHPQSASQALYHPLNFLLTPAPPIFQRTPTKPRITTKTKKKEFKSSEEGK